MMKTLKYIVLLTVMLVNVTPYIKDGKVEWKANEAAAQYYTIEDSGMGIWICGSYDDPFITLISRVDCYDLLPSQVSDEEAEFEDCMCYDCGYQKEYCQEPCPFCGCTVTVDDEGNFYPGTQGSVGPEFPAGTGQTGSELLQDIQNQIANGDTINSTYITGYPASKYVTNEGKKMWCAFYVTSLLSNLSACYIAESYYKKYKMAQDCSIDKGINPSHLDSLLSENGLSIEEEITNKEDIARSLINGKAVIGAKLDTAVGHVVAAYEIVVDVRNPISN